MPDGTGERASGTLKKGWQKELLVVRRSRGSGAQAECKLDQSDRRQFPQSPLTTSAQEATLKRLSRPSIIRKANRRLQKKQSPAECNLAWLLNSHLQIASYLAQPHTRVAPFLLAHIWSVARRCQKEDLICDVSGTRIYVRFAGWPHFLKIRFSNIYFEIAPNRRISLVIVTENPK